MMDINNPPFVTCPSCGHYQQTSYCGEPILVAGEKWLFDLTCDCCGSSNSFSDRYDRFDIKLTPRQWVEEIIAEKMKWK